MVSVSTCLALLKLVLICSGIVSIFIFCKIYVVPFILEELSNIFQFLVLWNSILNFLKPPYLFVAINFIIIIIAASSRFNNLMYKDSNYAPSPAAPVVVYVPSSKGSDGYEEKHVVVESGNKSINEGSSLGVEYDGDREESDFVVLRSKRKAKRRVDLPVSSPEIVLPAEKPFLFSSTSTRERPVNGGFQGARTRALMRKNSLQQQCNTLEDTWKAITNGRRIPESNDTWQEGDGQMKLLGPPSPPKKKSETFKDRHIPSHEKLRKEPSLNQDELNQRVEMFIRKFNEQMRLQRQQSLEQFHEMINRGL